MDTARYVIAVMVLLSVPIGLGSWFFIHPFARTWRLFVLAYVAFANYTGTGILYVLTFPAAHAVVLLEERELRDRFGCEFDEYCRRVPRYLPRW